jgi:hypothetical protein
MELRCRGDLAMWLGAVVPTTPVEHRALRDSGHLLVRDPGTGWPLFWRWQLTDEEIAARSS